MEGNISVPAKRHPKSFILGNHQLGLILTLTLQWGDIQKPLILGTTMKLGTDQSVWPNEGMVAEYQVGQGPERARPLGQAASRFVLFRVMNAFDICVCVS